MIRRLVLSLALVGVLALAGSASPQVRLKDVARLQGVRENQLVGYGLVIGLNGTGDSSRSAVTVNSIRTALSRFGVQVPSGSFESKNVASVLLTATLPPFAQSGDRIDVTISAIGDAKSLSNGVLLQTPLQAANGQIYAVAQGAISLGGGAEAGAAARGAGAGGYPTVARLPQGALIEREMHSSLLDADGSLTWTLHQPDFTTASRMAEAVNAVFEPDVARAIDAGTVKVIVPENLRADIVGLVSRIESIRLEPDAEARVVVNERTGTVVFGENVRVSEVAVTHATLNVTVRGEVAAGQGGGLPGAGSALGAATVTLEEDRGNIATLPASATVRDVVRALNAVGARPRDIIAILQAMATSGALHARLEIL